jgi:TetR/AcrR family transcriptional regulator
MAGDMEKTVNEQILDSATRLFAEKGFAGVSLQDVAEASGIEEGELTKLFGSREKLYEAVLEPLFSKYAVSLGAPFQGGDRPVTKVELFASAMCDFRKQSPYFFPLFYRELLNPSPFFESIVLKNIRHVAYLSDNNIAKGIQKGSFRRGVNPANVTMAMLGMFHYYFLANRLAGSLLPENTTDEVFFSQAMKLFLSGLMTGE